MDDDVRLAADAVAACLRVMADGDLNDVDLGKVLWMLACVLEHPDVLV